MTVADLKQYIDTPELCAVIAVGDELPTDTRYIIAKVPQEHMPGVVVPTLTGL